jgi:molybdopterin molybdotransferase
VISFDEAVTHVIEAARPLGTEPIGIADARRRVLAEPVGAMMSAPPADASAMDGYAVRDADLGALPARLRLIGESFAGSGYQGAVAPGTCVRIFTGAPVPAGADRVVIQEMVGREGDVAVIGADPGKARHIRPYGSDFREGDVLLEPGRMLDTRALVAAAAADVAELIVWRRPRVQVLGTGDELVEPGGARHRSGAIPESVSFGVAALVEDWGGAFAGRRHLADDLAAMSGAAAEAVDGADLVVVTGGASVGEKDFAKPMFGPDLELVFSKVAIKPGKPVWLGRVGATLVLGLPGNPTSALVTGRLLLAPLVAGLGGRDPGAALVWRPAPLGGALAACGDRETFVRARSEAGSVHPLSNQDSGAQRALAEADLLIRRRPHAPAAELGEVVEVLDF